MLITRTPFRISFYGGGLDYPSWYKNNQSIVLCGGLDYYCYQTVRNFPPFFENKYRAAYSKIELVNEINDIQHPAIREAVRTYSRGKPVEVSHIGDLPARSGIGSSSAFTVGLILSLNALNGDYIGCNQLAQEAIRLEQDVMKEKVGFQDQCASSFGGLVLIKANNESISPKRFIVSREYKEHISSSLLMGFNGLSRYSSISSNRTIKSIETGFHKSLLEDLYQLSISGVEAFSKQLDIDKHAEITKKSRDIKMRLNGDIKDINTLELIETSEKAGSLCTRFMGAGGGGFFVCWAPQSNHQKIIDSLPTIKTWVKVRFSTTGSQVIFADQTL